MFAPRSQQMFTLHVWGYGKKLRAATVTLVDLLLLGGVSFKAPGLTIGVNLAMLFKYSSILSCCTKVLGDDGINAAPQALIMRISPVNKE